MAPKPTLSPTKISTYLVCPTKYKWTYIDDRGRWYLRSKSYYSFGATLHKVLQRFHDANDMGVTSVHQAVATLEEDWISAGYASQQEMMEALGEGKAIVEGYIESFQAEPTTAETLFVEKQLRADLGPFVLIGRLDRVDQHADGEMEVIDYKSGRSGISPEDVATDLAMCCYQLLLREHYPSQAVKATIVALRSGQRASAALSDEELAHFRQDLIVIGQEILDRDYENLEPTWKPLCLECDFLTLCRKHVEFEPIEE